MFTYAEKTRPATADLGDSPSTLRPLPVATVPVAADIPTDATRRPGADFQEAGKCRENAQLPLRGASWSWIVPHGLWEAVKPLIPEQQARPQGGGTPSTSDEALFAAIVYVLVSGCAWRSLPPCFEVSKSTAHRRFLMWSKAGVWQRLHEVLLDRLRAADALDFSRAAVDFSQIRALKGGRRPARPRSIADGPAASIT